MRSRVIILFGIANALALAAGFHFLRESLAVSASKSAAASKVKTVQPAQRATMSKLAQRNPSAPVVIYKTNQFEWSQLESTDYRKYIANLRAIGCPEPTLKDLIMADVLRLYAARRGQFYHNGRAFKYWETDDKRKLKPDQLAEREKQLALIDKELPAVLRELLGINYERELNKYFIDSQEDGRRLGFLSEEKQAQVLALRDQWEGKRERLLNSVQNGRLSATELYELRKLDKERNAALKNILSPEEYEQYELSTSDTADRLRKELVGFNPTEKEFREIFSRQQALDAKYADQDLTDEAVRAAKEADQQRLEAELAPLLGEARASELQRSKTEEYRDFYTFAEQYELTPTTSQTLLEMRQFVESERQKLLSNKDLAADTRLEALMAIQAETAKTFKDTMGEKTYAAYAQGLGQWIQKLGEE